MLRTACIGAVLAVSSIATADLVIDDAAGTILDITAAVGAGASTAYLVIDFGYTGGDSHAFAFNFDGDASVHDAFSALAEGGFTYLFDDFGEWGLFVNNLGWSDDLGDPSNYWAHSLATPDGSGSVNWIDAATGVDTTMLADGLLSGWYNGFNDDYTAITPTLPVTTVPGPSVLVIMGLGLIPCRRRPMRARASDSVRCKRPPSK